jgi:hypothetical protein
MPEPVEKRLRLPVILRGGQWELQFGGAVPVEDGQMAELIVPEKALTDKKLVKAMQTQTITKILERGQPLRVFLATRNFKGVTEEQQQELLTWDNWRFEIDREFFRYWNTAPKRFFEIVLGPATEPQMKDLRLRDGGLWLVMEGGRAKELRSSQFEFPECVTTEKAISLNHAVTLLSEVYEPWRKSHTGNVYDRILYQEDNGKWYPLSLLRDFTTAKEEQNIAYGLFKEFMNTMSPISKAAK